MNQIDHEKLTRMAVAARAVAGDIRSGRLCPGKFQAFSSSGVACCSIGHVLDVFGVAEGRKRIMNNGQAVANEVGYQLGLNLECGIPQGAVRLAVLKVMTANDTTDGDTNLLAFRVEELATAIEAVAAEAAP